MYDKIENRWFFTQVKSTANECKLYSLELEKYLSENIECPANDVLDKVRGKQELSTSERITLSNYIAVMIKRVPESKKLIKEHAPAVAETLRYNLHKIVDETISEFPAMKDQLEMRRLYLDDIVDHLSRNPPLSAWYRNIPVEQTPELVMELATMSWHFFVFDDEPVFLTGDNPVHFFKEFGIGNSESELTFPISSHVVLWATRDQVIDEGYYAARMPMVKEFNRRLAANTSRYVFHARSEEWILPFLRKKKRKLNLIRNLEIVNRK